MMKSKEIRQKFFDFFTSLGHKRVSSSSLIPAEDPTLLFANAGMNQFKDVFLGKEKRSYDKAVTIQKCVRAGGKHNDLDNVGFTKRHLTFFEMMGNFSFGDYFKRDAIRYAWDFLTKELGLPIDKLHVSVYKDDDESYNIWRDEIGVPEERIHRLGAEENFWQMGDTGPCGPSTEIHIDRGPAFGHKDISQCGPACQCDRFLELWNVVFMQYNRQPDGTDVELKQKGVDTGMGLERLTSVLQDKDSVFEIDLFVPIIKKTEQLTGQRYAEQTGDKKAAFHVLADHIRSASLLIADGCAPSNEGRGYVLRKIIRRAALFAQKLTDKNIFPELAQVIVSELGDIYPELKQNHKLIKEVLTSEINKFATNLVRGNQILQKYMAEHLKDKVITGQQAFKMYDTFGFPTELIEIIAKEHDFTVDMDGFEKHMQKQKEQSGKKEKDDFEHIKGLDPNIKSEFTGYQELETPSNIIALVHNFISVDKVPAGTSVFVIAEKSPFFIVGGGQVPDQGWITIKDQQVPIKQVRFIGKGIAAEIEAPVALTVGDKIISTVHEQKRIDAMKNHTATHLLQSALIQLFGKQIKQSGSLVHPDYLRFDFTYHGTLSDAEIKQIEDIVNAKIRENILVSIEYMPYRKSIKMGALAFFGEKYNPENVRVVNIPGFSVELCGGTHVDRTGDIGTFKITQEVALAAGHRRIFAVTGPKAVSLFQETFGTVKTLSHLFKVKHENLLEMVEKLQEQHKELQKELKKAKQQALQAKLHELEQQTVSVNNIPFLFASFVDIPADLLKEAATQLANKKSGFYFFISEIGKQVQFITVLSDDLAIRVNLKDFGSWLKENTNLRGGGSKTILQGGGTEFGPDLEDRIHLWIKNNT